MTAEIHISSDPGELAESFAGWFSKWLEREQRSKERIYVALSGGSTPKKLFEILASRFQSKVDWRSLHLFWVDERCVPPGDPESNFGVANTLLLEPIGFPIQNIHRVMGESDPTVERERYESEIRQSVPVSPDGHPVFDWILLGMGDDGHTASIFPHQMEFLHSKRDCEVATHPTSGQKRITLTGPVINAAANTVFLITGANKADVARQVIEKCDDFEQFPASHITGINVSFWLDAAAAGALSES